MRHECSLCNVVITDPGELEIVNINIVGDLEHEPFSTARLIFCESCFNFLRRQKALAMSCRITVMLILNDLRYEKQLSRRWET